MREIKFRAWLKLEKKMVDVRSLEIEHELVEYRDEEDDIIWCKAFNTIDLMQFTGLYDKYGKPIYEGDIVEDAKIKLRGAVRYNQKDSSFKLFKLGDIEYCPSAYLVKKFEVIGNIYENADLLEEVE